MTTQKSAVFVLPKCIVVDDDDDDDEWWNVMMMMMISVPYPCEQIWVQIMRHWYYLQRSHHHRPTFECQLPHQQGDILFKSRGWFLCTKSGVIEEVAVDLCNSWDRGVLLSVATAEIFIVQSSSIKTGYKLWPFVWRRLKFLWYNNVGRYSLNCPYGIMSCRKTGYI